MEGPLLSKPADAQNSSTLSFIVHKMASGLPPAGIVTAEDDRKGNKHAQPHVTIVPKHDEEKKMLAAEWHGAKSVQVCMFVCTVCSQSKNCAQQSPLAGRIADTIFTPVMMYYMLLCRSTSAQRCS